MGCLYQLTSPSGKSYIGISKHGVDVRWKGHVIASRKRRDGLYGAIRKYGPESFKRKVLVVADDETYLRHIERRAIVAFGTMAPLGYNLVEGGGGVLNPCDQTRAAMSESARRAWTPERAESLRRRTAVYWAAPGSKEKAAVRMRAIATDPNVKAKASASHKKKWLDPEHREKMSAIRKACPASGKEKRRLGILAAWARKPKEFRVGTRTGMKHSEETIGKMAEAARLRSTPEYRAKVAASVAAVWAKRKQEQHG